MIRFLQQLFCGHHECLTRRAGTMMFTECLVCGRQTQGILTGRVMDRKGNEPKVFLYDRTQHRTETTWVKATSA